MTISDLQIQLTQLSGEEATASFQGALLGRASAAPATAVTTWPDEVLGDLPDGAGTVELRLALTREAAETVKALEEGQLTLELFVPSDDEPLVDRTQALAQWCQGFLVGLAAAGVKDVAKLPGDVPEFLSDVLSISQAVAPDDGEADEQAFTELVEYLRVGVQLVHDVMNEPASDSTIQ